MSDDREEYEVYDLFTRGTELLEAGDFNAAAVPLERASRLEPDKGSIREALGRAYFRSGRYAKARDEFAASSSATRPTTTPCSAWAAPAS